MHPQLIRNRRAFFPQKPRLSQSFQKLTVSGWTLASAGSSEMSFDSWNYLNIRHTRPNTGAISATMMMTAPAVDGSYEARFLLNDGYTLLASAAFTIVPPAPPPAPVQPVITVTPNTPEAPDTTPLGAVIATFSVVMSDGSPFTGTVAFGAPYFDGGGIFALSGDHIIVNPTGPGVGPNMTTLTDHITLEAIP
jgi:hypothetical protein